MNGGEQFGGLIQRGNATLCTVLELCRLELFMECEVLLGETPSLTSRKHCCQKTTEVSPDL